jgi:hypothetical protein
MPHAGMGENPSPLGKDFSLEAISKKGFWFKFKAGPNFNPQAY